MKRFIPICLIGLVGSVAYGGDVWDYSVPNMAYLHRTTGRPWDIHVLLVDLKNPGLRLETVLSHDQLWGRETVSAMAKRHGAMAAINGDFFSSRNGIPQGLTVRNHEIVIAPKYRSALGFTENKSALVGMWTDRWNWYAKLIDEQGNSHEIVMMNLDVNTDWLCLFTDKYGHATPGNTISNQAVEVVVDSDSLVQQIRTNQAGVSIPRGWFVLTGREQAAAWLAEHLTIGERIHLHLTTVPDWRNLWQAISGGPRIIQNGKYYADPLTPFPGGEDFELSYKTAYYNSRQPRSAAGITANGDTLILVVVDGRQPGHSVGMTLQELANLLLEFGAVQGLQFDTGGSATFFFHSQLRNRPSDGSERAVANSLCLFSSRRYVDIAPLAKIIDYCGASELPSDESIEKLIDGKRSRNSSKWVHISDHTHWVELDLQHVYQVTHFQLFHGYYTGDPDYLNTREFRIFTRVDSVKSWEQDFHVINDQWQPRDNLCSYPTPRPVRFVRLEIPQANHVDYENTVRLSEFSIYIEDTTATAVPRESETNGEFFELQQNYPNPFNHSTMIDYLLPTRTFVALNVFDLAGRKVATLVSGWQDRGEHRYEWNAIRLPAGIYFYQLKAGKWKRVAKMIYLK